MQNGFQISCGTTTSPHYVPSKGENVCSELRICLLELWIEAHGKFKNSALLGGTLPTNKGPLAAWSVVTTEEEGPVLSSMNFLIYLMAAMFSSANLGRNLTIACGSGSSDTSICLSVQPCPLPPEEY